MQGLKVRLLEVKDSAGLVELNIPVVWVMIRSTVTDMGLISGREGSSQVINVEDAVQC